MTITPTGAPAGANAAALGLAAVSGSADATAPAGAADFLAAILQALTAAGEQVAGEGAAEVLPDTDGDAEGDTDTDADAVLVDPAGLGLVLPPALVAQLAGGAGGVPGEPGAAAPANVADVAQGNPTGPAGDIRMSGDASPATAAAVAPAHANVADGTQGDPTGPTSDIRMSGDVATAPAPAATTPTDQPAAPGTATTGLQPVGTATAPTAPTAGTTSPAAAQHVTRQIFPEVTSLVSRGEGTHRITLALQPEALGEVRVVMTVRDGSVHVRLAAGHEAQQALLDGSHELVRLLEQTGMTDSRVVVRDLGSATAAATAGQSTQLGAGGAGPQDQHAGTRAQHHATDGTQDGGGQPRNAGGADLPRSNEPVTRTRAAGVDVTM